MGLQPISNRRLRHAAQATGLPLIRAMRHSNHLWFGWVAKDDGHWHIDIDPATWEWEYDDGCQFSSCAQGTYGPRVNPDQAVLQAQELIDLKRRAARLQAAAQAEAFAAAWREETERWLQSR